VNDILQGIKSAADYIQSAPLSVLTIIFLNGLGYALKYLTFIPNRSIPLALMLAGALVMMFLAPVPEGRNPLVLLGLMGWIFGCIAWATHAVILKRIEKFLPGGDPEASDKNQPPTLKP
jgi:hypothetical protein